MAPKDNLVIGEKEFENRIREGVLVLEKLSKRLGEKTVENDMAERLGSGLDLAMAITIFAAFCKKQVVSNGNRGMVYGLTLLKGMTEIQEKLMLEIIKHETN